MKQYQQNQSISECLENEGNMNWKTSEAVNPQPPPLKKKRQSIMLKLTKSSQKELGYLTILPKFFIISMEHHSYYKESEKFILGSNRKKSIYLQATI